MRSSSFSSSPSPFSAVWPSCSPDSSHDLLVWLDIRDNLFGHNFRQQDVQTVLSKQQCCNHPDAVWLFSVCKGVSSKKQARQVFHRHREDARALCFGWFLDESGIDDSPLFRAAEMGYAFACSTLSGRVGNDQEAFRLAQKAAAQHERDGYRRLSYCYQFGIGCERDTHLAKQNQLIAAELGHVLAARDYGLSLENFDPARWIWLRRAAMRGSTNAFLTFFPTQVEQFFSGSGSSSIVFSIGRAWNGNLELGHEKMFCFDSVSEQAKRAVEFYQAQVEAARKAVDSWTITAIRLNLIKDMRIFIGKMIWDMRFEANYKI